VCAGVADRWLKQYGHGFTSVHGPKTWQQIHAELVALGPNPDAAGIRAVIGNGSWTALNCESCGAKSLDAVIDIGAEDNITRVCFACITKARNLALDALTPKGPEDYGVGSF